MGQVKKDALGQELFDFLEGQKTVEIIERDDGMIAVGPGAPAYFSEYDEWSEIEKQAIGFAQGRVLDIGCGAGRHSLYLQEKGLEVIGIDNSPKAVEVCKRRGLKKALMLPASQVSSRMGCFDTILMLGNNFGLLANPKRANWLLRRFHRMTSEKARIIASSRNPYATNDPDHLAYHQRNLQRGRMIGQLRIRVRYRTIKGDWFEYLLVSQEEMVSILEKSGWKISKLIQSEPPQYIAIIEKAKKLE